MTALLLVGGLAVLTAGAELLVRGAVRLAAGFGVSPLAIGLTVVAFGTSAPEIAVSVFSAVEGRADVAMGNVVGSNIFNILFILGASALVLPLAVDSRLVRIDVPILVGLSVLVLLLALDGRIGRMDGVVLLAGMVAYTVFTYRAAGPQGVRDPAPSPRRWGRTKDLASILAGLLLLVLGARLFLEGAIDVARALGMSELVIGLTIVAAGTSLPEMATSLLASIRGQRDIAVGNAVGSNILNLLCVLGLSAAVAPDGVAAGPSVRALDLPVMIAVATLCLPVFFTGRRIGRREGALFLGYYALYSVYIVLDALAHERLPAYSQVVLWGVLPLTALPLAWAFAAELRARRAAGKPTA